MSAELRALAEKATPGPWRQGYREGKYVYTGVDDFLTGPIRAENAAYIAAASPDVILALLDELDLVKFAAAAMQRDLDERDAAIRRAAEWARWITAQTRRTDWACRECVDADVRGQDNLVIPDFECVWHAALRSQGIADADQRPQESQVGEAASTILEEKPPETAR